MTSHSACTIDVVAPDATATPTASPLDLDAENARPRANLEVGSRARRFEIGPRHADAAPLVHGYVEAAGARLPRTGKVGIRGMARLDAGLEEASIDVVEVERGRHPQRSLAAVIGPGAPRVALRAPEVRQQVGIAPAGQALVAPTVVVAPVAAGVDHAVEDRRAAQGLAARIVDAAAVEGRLRLAPIAPVEGRVAEQEAVAGGHPHEQAVGAAARLDDQHSGGFILAQPGGQH